MLSRSFTSRFGAVLLQLYCHWFPEAERLKRVITNPFDIFIYIVPSDKVMHYMNPQSGFTELSKTIARRTHIRVDVAMIQSLFEQHGLKKMTQTVAPRLGRL
jgi:hypothetical protein